MTSDDARNDPVLAALSQLHGHDVDHLRAHRLRIRCRAALVAERRAADAGATMDGAVWRRVVAPALLGAWCAIYVVEVMRLAAAIYGL
jgi:hypothetical protein